MKKINKILIGLALLLIGAQFIQIDKSNPQVDISKDFIARMNPDPEEEGILRRACYDCHSNETKYPWYASITPINFWLKDHIEEGRAELNFSIWGSYKAKRMDHKLEECVELVDKGEMPLESYTWIHKEAELSNEDRAKLAAFFSSLR